MTFPMRRLISAVRKLEAAGVAGLLLRLDDHELGQEDR